MFRRPAVRWAVVVLPLAWGAFELWLGHVGWAALFAAAGAYAAWELFIRR